MEGCNDPIVVPRKHRLVWVLRDNRSRVSRLVGLNLNVWKSGKFRSRALVSVTGHGQVYQSGGLHMYVQQPGMIITGSNFAAQCDRV